MILNASQRGGGQNLAAHLMKMEDNEHVCLHELRGFVSENLNDAFKEAEAISRGTRCRQYLFSLSLNPPEDARVPVEVFESTIERIEQHLGLEGQPRAIVFHEKEGRRHAHCVWSRIDAQTMTARQLSFFKQKLTGISRDLYLEQGWTMPRGIAEAGLRDPANFTLAEWQQARRQDMDPRWLKQVLQGCWTRSDSGPAFAHSLEEHGFTLARGDKRGFVVIDHQGEVWSLPRMLDLKTKEVRSRLGDSERLPDVTTARQALSERMTPAIRRHIAEARERFQERSEKLGSFKAEMTQLHRREREKLDQRHRAEWEVETRARADRLPKGLLGLWHRITGCYQDVRHQNEIEVALTRTRQAEERQRLIEGQLAQRAVLQSRFKDLRREQADRLLDLRRDIGRYRARARPEQARERNRAHSLKLER